MKTDENLRDRLGPEPETGAPGQGGKVFGFEDDEQMQSLKEIKVKLPVSQHIKLHSLKITRNRSISDVVAQALDDYFAKLENPDAPREAK